ncbi:MAG: MATE family efflux transporter [Acutalibacteraceae bacterium]
MKNNNSVDMCNGSLFKSIIRFSVPLMLSGILQLLFNAADVIVVGKFSGDESLAAVGATTTLINLLTNLFIGLSVGSNVLVGNYLGANQEKDVKETVHTSMLLSVISGIILTVVGFVFAPALLKLMQTPEDVINLSVIYLRTYFSGMTAVMIYNFGAAILRAAGDTKRALYYLFASGVVNVCLNLIFVIAFKWGVFGVGLATVISQIISACLIVMALIREKSIIKLSVKKLCIYKHKLLRIMQIGIPAGFQGMMFSLSNTVIQSAINSFGKVVVAASAASVSVEGFAFTSMNSFHQAAVSFTSQNYGAGKRERINKILYISLMYVFIVGAMFGVIFLVFGKNLIGFYTDSPEVVAEGVKRLTIIACSYMLCGMMDVTSGSLRGLGYSFIPMIVSLLGVCVFRVVWIMLIFKIEQFHVVETIYYSYPISWIMTFAAHFITFIIAKSKLKKKLIKV